MNISQVAKLTGLSAKQIRDYEKNGLLPQAHRTEAGYRFYSEQELARLHFISNARKVGFSLAQIIELLKLNDSPNRTSREVKQLTAQHIQALTQRIEQLQIMVNLLQRWHFSCQGNDTPDCPILNGLHSQTEICCQKTAMNANSQG